MSDSRSWVGADCSIREVQQKWMSDRQDVCWFAALGMCRCPTNAVVGVQQQASWQSFVGYAGRRSCSALYTSTAILNCTRWLIAGRRDVLAPCRERIVGVGTGCRWSRTVVSCNSPGVLRWTPRLATWRHQTTVSGLKRTQLPVLAAQHTTLTCVIIVRWLSMTYFASTTKESTAKEIFSDRPSGRFLSVDTWLCAFVCAWVCNSV